MISGVLLNQWTKGCWAFWVHESDKMKRAQLEFLGLALSSTRSWIGPLYVVLYLSKKIT